MNSHIGELFSKSMRLRKRADFLRVQRLGRRVQSRAFIGLVLLTASGCARLGITTTKRLGNAVERNRIRRLVREAYRRGLMRIPNQADLVVVAKKDAMLLSSADVFTDLTALGIQVESLAAKREPPCVG